jgi:hypothetical protein
MEIRVQPAGMIRQHFPEEVMTFTLEDNSNLSDLYDEIGSSIGSRLPKSIWNHKKNRFRGPVIVTSDNVILKSEDTLLHENQLIKLKRFLVGG